MKKTCSIVLGKTDIGDCAPELENYTRYHAFGYYDYVFLKQIESYEDSDSVPFSTRVEAVKNLHGSANLHIMKLYFDSEDQSRIDAYTRFWETDNPVFVITFIHRMWTDVDDERRDWKRIEDKIYKEIKQTNDFRFVCLRSIALSDCVVLWKTNSISNVLRSLEAIYQIEDVGYTWSICGLDVLKNNDSFAEETLSCINIRLIQRDAQKTKEVIEKIDILFDTESEKQQNNIIGHENLCVRYENIALRLLPKYLKEIEDNEILRKAAYSIDTQVGNREENRWSKEVLESKLVERYMELLARFEKTCDNDELFEKYPWLNTVYDLLNQSVHMSKSFVADEVCSITYGSLDLFVDLFGKMIKTGTHSDIDYIVKTNEEGIQKFIRGYQLFLEQIMKIDGPMVYEPGYHPILFDVPAKLLNYYTTFCKKLVLACKTLEYGKFRNTRTECLIVPKLCRKIKVMNVMPLKEPCDNLLIIDLPYSEMYNPQQVLVELAHEIMHYEGDAFRERKTRKRLFVELWAKVIESLLEIPNNDPERKRFFEDLNNTLNVGVDVRLSKTEEEDKYYLQVVSKAVFLEVESFFGDWKKAMTSLDCLSQRNKNIPVDVDMGISRCVDAYLNYCTYSGRVELEEIHKELCELLSDCFSDWAVNMIIDDTYEKYIDNLLGEYFSTTNCYKNMGRMVRALTRATIVTLAVKNGFNVSTYKQLESVRKKYNQNEAILCIIDYIQAFTGTKSQMRRFLKKYGFKEEMFYDFGIIETIVEYLRCCNLKARDFEEKQKHELKNMWVNSKELCSDGFMAYLNM